MTRQEALALMAILQSAYPRWKDTIDTDTINLYVKYLLDLDYKVAEQAIQNHILTEKWFPSIAEIREGCVKLVHSIPTADEAIAIVRKAIRRNDPSLYKQNELISQAVNTVGFERLGYSEYPEQLYKQIKETYENLRQQEIRRLQSSPGVGTSEAIGTAKTMGMIEHKADKPSKRQIFGDDYEYRSRGIDADKFFGWGGQDEKQTKTSTHSIKGSGANR